MVSISRGDESDDGKEKALHNYHLRVPVGDTFTDGKSLDSIDKKEDAL